jgi:hypothetical protein
MAERGFYQMARGWQDNPLFGNAEYSERDAWVWLVEHAAWRPTKLRVKGVVIDLIRGQLCFAQRFMAEKWRWSKSRVDRFLKRLSAESMISICSKNGATAGHPAGQGQSVISICNYDKYQSPEAVDRGNAVPENGATAGQQRGKEEEYKKDKKEEERSLTADAASDYAFSGRVIRLKEGQFSQWQAAYPNLDLRAVLQSRDDWLATEADPGARSRWFMSTSNWLAARHSRATADERQARVAGFQV